VNIKNIAMAAIKQPLRNFFFLVTKATIKSIVIHVSGAMMMKSKNLDISKNILSTLC
jgi:hypothetical protein